MSNYPNTKIYNTLPKILRHRSENMPDTVALRDKDLGIWNEITWKQYNDQVSYLALSLAKRGFKPGDVIGLIGDNKHPGYSSNLQHKLLVELPIFKSQNN